MTVAKFIPVAVTVGILAALWALVGSALNLILWVPFLSWALFFGAGAGKFSRVPKEVIGLTGGTVAAVVLLLLLPLSTGIFGPTWGLPVLVFLAAFIIVLLELTNLFELAPAYFYSFAGFFAYFFGGFGGKELALSMALNFWILLLVGTALGMLTGLLRKIILDIEKVPPGQRQTIFDKEKTP